MKKILYACRDIKYAVRGLEFLLSNKDIVLKGCLISQNVMTIRKYLQKKIFKYMMMKIDIKIEQDLKSHHLTYLFLFSYPKKIEDFIINKANRPLIFILHRFQNIGEKACCRHEFYNGNVKQSGEALFILTSEFDGGAIIEQRFFKITPICNMEYYFSNAAWNLRVRDVSRFNKMNMLRQGFFWVWNRKRGNYYSKRI